MKSATKASRAQREQKTKAEVVIPAITNINEFIDKQQAAVEQSPVEPVAVEQSPVEPVAVEQSPVEPVAVEQSPVAASAIVPPVVVKKVAAASTLSEAVRKTWLNPNTAAARRQRNGVKVDGVEYGSVRKAFTALRLPDSKHIAFRGRLKAAGKLAFGEHEFVLMDEK
jgi:hypothetical protein